MPALLALGSMMLLWPFKTFWSRASVCWRFSMSCAPLMSGQTAQQPCTQRSKRNTHTGIEAHQRKKLTAASRVADPTAIVWRGDLELPPEEQCVKILSTPLGHSSFVRSQLATLSAHVVIRAIYIWRVVHPKLSASFAARHDAVLRRAVGQLVSVPPSSLFWDVAIFPFTMGGMGFRSMADMIVTQMDHEDAGFHVSGAAQVRCANSW